jgi:hypothetical protein
VALGAAGQVQFDLPGEDLGSPIRVSVPSPEHLLVEWPVDPDGATALVTFNFEQDARLIEEIAWRDRPGGDVERIASNLEPGMALTEGTRRRPGFWMVFYDKPWTRPYSRFPAEREVRKVSVTSSANRAQVVMDGASAGSFSGRLVFTFFAGVPLVQAEAVLSTNEDGRAIIYDAGLVAESGEVKRFQWIDARSGVSDGVDAGAAAPRITRHRAMVAEMPGGAIAVFPPPHQYIYPLDHAVNLGFNWAGRDYDEFARGDGWGVCLSPEGDKRSTVWVNAPPGTSQRLSVFYLLGRGSASDAIEQVKRFTNGDRYRSLAGFKTFASHFHVEHTLDLLHRQKESGTGDVPPDLMEPGFVRAFRSVGLDMVHLAEFHNQSTPFLRTAERLRQLHTLFAECERLSDESFLLIPGEEGIVHIGGHWMTLFARPVDWVQEHLEGQPAIGTGPDGQRAYFVGSAGEVLTMMEAEDGLMWTAHPRLKSSPTFPDAYRDERFFLSPRFLGATWKAMPMDYSEDVLGRRGLDVMDDMAQWGVRKQVLGEVDIFKVEPDYELYGHCNVNYLKLDRIPRFHEGWRPVLDSLRSGQFFTTTGEVLIPEFTVNDVAPGGVLDRAIDAPLRVRAKLEWTFPLRHAEIVGGDGRRVHRHRIDLSDTGAFGAIEIDETLAAENWRWIRLEVADVAVNTAFTQQVWIE